MRKRKIEPSFFSVLKTVGFLSCIFLIVGNTSISNDPPIPEGTWLILDENTGEVRSEVKFYLKNGQLNAKLTKLVEGHRDAKCEDCPGEYRGKKLLEIDLIKGLEWTGEQWTGGKIIDVDEGKVYDCRINHFDKEELEIRGYLKSPLFGRTVRWERKTQL